MIATFYMLSETVQRDISEPEFFDTFEAAREEMLSRLRVTLDTPEDISEQALLKLAEARDGDIMESEAYCTNKNHDDCDWKIHEVCLPLTVDGKLIS